MTAAHYYIGDVFDVMAGMPDGSVDLVLTSPPFLALRSYLPADHPDKAKEIGSEPTPAEFLDTLLALTAEWRRLLAPHGSIAVELGDTYAGSGGAGGDYNAGGLRDGQEQFSGSASKRARNGVEDGGRPPRSGRSTAWPLDKSLCIIPELYAACLAYGRNVLTGEPSPAGQWRVRNLVRWVRPNPPVGALGDKFRPATSVMTVATIARDRWFDLDDVREAYKKPHVIGKTVNNGAGDEYGDGVKSSWSTRADFTIEDRGGAPPLDWWNIPTEPYSGSHYATWPRKLCERPIRSMCPREVCRVCGEPRRRVVDVIGYVDNAGRPASMDMSRPRLGDPKARQFIPTGQDSSAHRIAETVGWTDCDCDWSVCRTCGMDDDAWKASGMLHCPDPWHHAPKYRPGIVLDPFAGSGTTGAVATGLGRDFIGIDLDERNTDLATERIGPLLIDVIDTREGAA